MNKQEIEQLAERYQAKADRAYQNYQETGMSRYDRERRNNEDLATALRMAAAAHDDHARLISMRCDVAEIGAKAQNMLSAPLHEKYTNGEVRTFLQNVVAIASTYGLIREDE